MISLNLGSSDRAIPGYVAVDVVPRPEGMTGEYQKADLALPWLWPDSSVERIYAADIFEHIGDCQHTGKQICSRCMPREIDGRHWSGRIHVMNESWRVLQPGGILTMECPDASKGAGQWQDCTHVQPWTPNGLQYFADGSGAHKRFAVAYGITARFRVLSVTERMYAEMAGPTGAQVNCEVWKFTAKMECVK